MRTFSKFVNFVYDALFWLKVSGHFIASFFNSEIFAAPQMYNISLKHPHQHGEEEEHFILRYILYIYIYIVHTLYI